MATDTTMTQPDNIHDVFPDDPSDYETVALLECAECGETGRMYSTGRPRRQQWWDCEACGTTDAKHRVVLSTQNGVPVEP